MQEEYSVQPDLKVVADEESTQDNAVVELPEETLLETQASETTEASSESSEDKPVEESATPNADKDGIEILVAMAAKNEIDPKNIDIIDVTDRFLRAIAAAPKENLRQSGKILFHASVLLRMKAEAMLIEKIEDFDFAGDDFLQFDEDGSPIISDQPRVRQITLADLEKALVRRAKVRQLKQRKVTLEQLIEALREAERMEKERGTRTIKPRIDLEGHADMQDLDDILDLAHDEDIEDIMARIEQILIQYFIDNSTLSLLDLIKKLDGKGDWVDSFLSVLFLSNAGKISLSQEKFYGPLFIERGEIDMNQPVAEAG